MASFRNDWDFLSNFFPAPVLVGHGSGLRDVQLPTVEHAYVWYKTTDPAARSLVQMAREPGEAKRIGRKFRREGWDDIKRRVMLHLLRQKFSIHHSLELRLLRTGEDELIEENEWGDVYWGTCNGVGENHLGRLLAKVRTELRARGI